MHNLGYARSIAGSLYVYMCQAGGFLDVLLVQQQVVMLWNLLYICKEAGAFELADILMQLA